MFAFFHTRNLQAGTAGADRSDLIGSGGAGLLKESVGSGGAELSMLSALVEPTGIEPVTSCLQSRRSPS